MTSSIFLPRRSRAWPEPRTHLMESTMFVLPEPLGPTMAVTPPSNWISVCRAKVLKPSNCRDLRNKTGGERIRWGLLLAPPALRATSPFIGRAASLRQIDLGVAPPGGFDAGLPGKRGGETP